jgi:predicted MFS family arabinose efflux permease
VRNRWGILAVLFALRATMAFQFQSVAAVAPPQTRAIGMGLFYTLYYAAMMLGPVIAGTCAKWTGGAAAAFDFCALTILACPLILWGFNRIPAAIPKMAGTAGERGVAS